MDCNHDQEHAAADTRTLADRIAAVQRCGAPITEEQRAAAEQLLAAMLDAAGHHSVALATSTG